MADVTIEQQIIDHVRKLDDAQKQRVLEFVKHTLQQKLTCSARELMRLPFEERERLVAAAFEAAANEDFETFGS